MTYLKNVIGIESLVIKWCPGELSLRILPPLFSVVLKIIPLLSFCLLPLSYMDFSIPSPKQHLGGNPAEWGGGRWGESQPAAKKCSFPTLERSPSPNNNFRVITQCKLHL